MLAFERTRETNEPSTGEGSKRKRRKNVYNKLFIVVAGGRNRGSAGCALRTRGDDDDDDDGTRVHRLRYGTVARRTLLLTSDGPERSRSLLPNENRKVSRRHTAHRTAAAGPADRSRRSRFFGSAKTESRMWYDDTIRFVTGYV